MSCLENEKTKMLPSLITEEEECVHLMGRRDCELAVRDVEMRSSVWTCGGGMWPCKNDIPLACLCDMWRKHGAAGTSVKLAAT